MVQVSLSASTNDDGNSNVLIESARTIATLNFGLDSPPPELGLSVTIDSPELQEFDVNQIQIAGGTLRFTEDIQAQIATLLAGKISDSVPGATLAITSPLGNWSGASGLANIDTDTPVAASDRFEIGSVTKTFTAATLLKLLEAGALTLDDTLNQWLPESVIANVANASAITVRQLLNHTSGVAEYDFILLEQGMSDPTIFLRDWLPEEIVALIGNSDPTFAPGEGWQYSNTNYILAGMVIEAASGNTLASEIQTKIIEPLSLNDTFFVSVIEEIPGGYISGYLDINPGDGILELTDTSIANLSWAWSTGAIVSNTADLTRYAQALYQGDLLSEASQAEMFDLVTTGRGYEYGLGVMSFETPELGRIFGHRGGSLGFNANMWYAPEEDFTYVELLNGRAEESLALDTIPDFRNGPIAEIGNISSYGEFNLMLTEQTAQVLLPVADDGEVEGEEIVTFTIEPSPDYTINPEAQAATFTIEAMLPDRVITALDDALNNNLPSDVPGAAVAIITPEGEWFGASGVSDVENNIPLQPDDRFEAGSITKTFVATTILQLFEEGQLSLDDPLTDWLSPAFTDTVPNAGEITIEQILGHTSGVTDFTDVLFNLALETGNPGLFLQEWQAEQLVGFIDGLEPYFTPGEGWQYSNTNYILAAAVIEAVTGNSYGQEVRDRILDPLELDSTFVFGEEEIPGGYIPSYWDFDNNGTLDNLSVANLSWAGAAGSIISTTADLAAFFDGLLVDGSLLQPETLELMLNTIPVESPNYDSYGLGIGTLESRNRFWYVHRGQTLGFRSNLWYSPLEDITYVELLNGRSSSNLVSDLLPTYRRTIQPPTPDIVTYQFEWTGQIAEFSVDGSFSYDLSQPLGEDGIVREENLVAFDINFFAPDGVLLRSYEDNHLTFPEFNFAFDPVTMTILTDGVYFEPDGLNVGEKTPFGDETFIGLNLWSKSTASSPSLLHLDDWSDEFGFPIGYSTHEDIAFLTRTIAELIETGNVGDAYLEQIQDSLDQLGAPINVFAPPNQTGTFEVTSGVTSLFLDFTLFELAGLVIQDATPTATPFSNQFQLGFEVAESTNFSFESVPLTPLGGTINHIGDITFLAGEDTLVTIGDFEIGFDASRVSETNSGFFVTDTLDDDLGIGVLFDVGAPGRLIIANDQLTIADADLLLAPELAAVLGLNEAIGNDLGDTRLDAQLMPTAEEVVVLSLTATPEILNEAEGDFITYNFAVEGELPSEGLLFRSDDLFDVETDWSTFNFDNPGPDELGGLELVDFERVVADNGNATFIITWRMLAPTGFLRLPVLDDEIADGPDSAINVGLLPGEGYALDPEAFAVHVPVIDGIDNTGGPLISMAVSDTEVSEGDPLTITFTATGELPEGGQQIFVSSDIQNALGEFITVDDNGTPTLVSEGFSSLEPIFSGFLATMTSNTATISLNVFDDGPGEGPETFVYTLLDGETYDTDPDNSSFAITVDDTIVDPPSITFDESAGEDISNDPNNPQDLILAAGPNSIVASTGPGIEDQEFFTITIPEGHQLDEIILQSFSTSGNPAFIGVQSGELFTEPLDNSADVAALLGFTLFGDVGEAGTNILDDMGMGDGTMGFRGPLPSGDYTFAIQQLGTTTDYQLDFNVSQLSDGGPDDDVPVVSLTLEPAQVSEEGPETSFTFTLTVDGEIPTPEFDADGNLLSGGLPIFFDGNAGSIFSDTLDNFVIAGFTFGSIVNPANGGLEFILLQNTSSTSFNILNDIIEEGEESVTFNIFNDDEGLLNSNYMVNPDASSATITISDDNGGPGVGPTVGISVTEADLVEGDRFTIDFSVDGDIPAEGLPVLIQSPAQGAIGEFNIFDSEGNPAIAWTGLAGLPEAGDGFGSSFLATITAPDASITLSVFNDGPGEGEETLTFELINGEEYEVETDANSVVLTLNDRPPNTAPVAGDDSYRTEFETTLTVAAAEGVLNGDADADGDALTVAIDTDPSRGTVTLNQDGSFTYIPDADFSGEDSFTYTVSDGNGGVDVSTVTITVAERLNTPPEADDDSYSTSYDTALAVSVTDGVLNGDTDADGDSLTATLSTEPSHGSLDFKADGSFAYNPEGNYSGEDSFTYEVSDGNGGTDTSTVTLNIASAPDGASEIPGLLVDVSQIANDADELSHFAYDTRPAGDADVTTSLGNDVGDATDAVFDNLVGFYEVVDRAGGIDTDGDGVIDLRPGDAGYAQAALSNPISGLTIRAGSSGDPTRNTTIEEFGNVVLNGGQIFAPFVIANGGGLSPAEFLAINPNNDAATSIEDMVAYFGFSAANPDGVSHLTALGDNTFGFEDLPANLGISDNDYNDAVFQLTFS